MCSELSCLLPQDKPSFVRARVRKLLAAGVVSAVTCMVKTETPVLTNSCRELLARWACVAPREQVLGPWASRGRGHGLAACLS